MSEVTAQSLLDQMNKVYEDFNSSSGDHSLAARALVAAENKKIAEIEAIVKEFANVEFNEDNDDDIHEEVRNMIYDMAYSMDYNTEYMDLSLEDGTVSLWKNSHC